MPDAIWIDRSDELGALAQALSAQERIGVDTEFLRERTFFPKLCLLQLSAGERIWCVDTLNVGSLEPMMRVLTAAGTQKVFHAARQDLEAVYLTGKRVIAPVFDTQIAAGCIGLKPQIGYAELVMTLLNVALPKGQTRTDWSKRPLTREQLIYAADDVRYLDDIALHLTDRLRALGREHWATEDCLKLQDRELYEPDPAQAWGRLRGIAQLAPEQRARAKAIAVWREREARARDLPRAWILSDAALFSLSQVDRLDAGAVAPALLEALGAVANEPLDLEPGQDARPTPEQKILIDRLAKIVDARAAELKVSTELLAPRGELKALSLGKRDTPAISGWRAQEIGNRLLEAIG